MLLNPSRVYPGGNEALASPQQMDTPKASGNVVINTVNVVAQEGVRLLEVEKINGSVGRQINLALEMQTPRVGGSRAADNEGVSPITQKSMLKIQWFNSIEFLKKQVATLIEDITEKRLVEMLGGLTSYDSKKQAIEEFSLLWRQLLAVIRTMEAKIMTQLTYEERDVIHPSSNQLVSDLVITSVKDVETKFLELLNVSSLRFLDTVCTVHDIPYKHLINLQFDIRQWRKNNIDHIKSTQNANQSGSQKEISASQRGIFSFICCCCCVKTSRRPKIEHMNTIQHQITQS